MRIAVGPITRMGAILVLLTPVYAIGAQASTGEPWRINSLPQSSLVFANDGSLIGEIGRELRTSISIRTLPRYVGQAFVAVEDQRHQG